MSRRYLERRPRKLPRLDPDHYNDPEAAQRVRWYQVMRDADDYTERVGQGVAGVWGFIHTGEYAEARALMDLMLELERELYGPYPEGGGRP
ncbi:hypothetical protein [Kocuria sp. SM24M-10]|uniref:hypothetical protein n=1 Tax=Kocuria sp. SM24M-10 TaxID=1660349 RepID=UPI000649D788|nr:hypothetical protein [Kocuria sp. SM24M-10]KLU10012.1 hypothetical protein ABL57_09125 [Kocuria sp. SM24M-10]